MTIDDLRHAPSATHLGATAIPVSELLQTVAAAWPDERVELGALIATLGARGHGVLITLFALPNLLPFYVPGLSPVVGVPMLILCAQLFAGRSTPRLPGFVTRRAVSRARLMQVAERATPWLRRVERVVRPRRSPLSRHAEARLVGALGVLLSLVVILPTPFTNGPPALACLVMAMGLLAEDGVTILAGAAFGLLAAAFSLAILGSLGWALVGGIDRIL